MENNTKERKMYGLLLETMNPLDLGATIFLSVQYANSLEEAFILAKLEFEKSNPTKVNSLVGAKIGLFTVKTIEVLNEEHKTLDARILEHKALEVAEAARWLKATKDLTSSLKPVIPGQILGTPIIPKEKPQEIPLSNVSMSQKNLLMKEIIDKKDPNLLEQNKLLLSKEEIEYIKAQLK